MPDIVQELTIKAPRHKVFQAVSSPAGLDAWWTLTSAGTPAEGQKYKLGFGPGYDWSAIVSRCIPDAEFELEFTDSHEDWDDTLLGFVLEEKDGTTTVHFHHTHWPESNEHYKVSCYCWSMYLRLLKRYVERGEIVPYDDRLDA
jgi:uncharacterized protein YndB with AHSA1/START domain